MRVVALLCWYDESPTWLSHTVASLARAEVEHLVACDGAYQLFPGANERPSSDVEQAEAIVETARGLGIGCTIHAPKQPFLGNEVEKRSLLFRLGNLVAESWEDWFLLLDADEVVESVPSDLHECLAASEYDVAGVSLVTAHDPHATEAKSRALRQVDWPTVGQQGHRILLRALPSLRVESQHATYLGENRVGETICLRASADLFAQAPAEEIPELKILHRHEFRDLARRRAAKMYYEARDFCGVEPLPDLARL